MIAFLEGWHWLLPLVIVVTVLVLFHIVLNVLHRFFYPKWSQGKKAGLLFVLDEIHHPFRVFIWLSGFSLLATIYQDFLIQQDVFEAVRIVLKIGLIFTLAWAFFLVSKEGERVLLEKWHQDLTTVALFSKICFLAIGFISILLILPILGIPIGGLLAFGGLGGVVVGFAAKDALSNVFGGIVLAIDRPFKIGEWIYTTDGKVEGRVESIGWRMTKLRTYDKHVLYIPNYLFSSMIYVNRTRITHYRIWKILSLRYQDIEHVPVILKEVREYLASRSDLDKNEMHFIHLSDLSDVGLNLELRVYVKTADYNRYFQTMEEVLLAIYEIVRKAGGELAYPTQTIQVTDSNYEHLS